MWRCFNDQTVSSIPESVVLEEANGGYGHKSAYWVVYVSNDNLKTLQESDVFNYNTHDEHIYGDKLDSDLKADI